MISAPVKEINLGDELLGNAADGIWEVVVVPVASGVTVGDAAGDLDEGGDLEGLTARVEVSSSL